MSNEYPDREADPVPQAKEESRASASPVLTMAEATKFLDFSPDALIVVDADGSIVLVNSQAASLFGYAQAELPGQTLELLLPERWRAAHVAHRCGYVSTPCVRPMGVGLDLMGRRKNGSEFPVDISLRPVHIGYVLHVVAAIRDITTQRLLELERALQATLIDLAHDAILVRDPLSRIRAFSQGAQALYGWSEQEALGRVSHSLLQAQFPRSRAAVEAALEREGHWEGELIHTSQDGRQVTVESRQLLVRDEDGKPMAILEMNRDISRRCQLEQAHAPVHAEVLRERTFLHQVLDVLPSGVTVVHGPEARLVLINRAAASIWGAEWSDDLPMKEFLEMHQVRILDAQGRAIPPEAWATMRALLSGETVVQQQEVIRQPSGASLSILVNAVPLVSPHWQSLGAHQPPRHNGEPLALVIHQDVRLLKEAEYFKDEFIGITAHELRQPLTVLKGAVGTLLLQTARGHGTPLADWQQEMLQDLDQATDRLIDLVDDLLDVSRLQAGRLSLLRTSTDVVSLTERVIARLQKATSQHHLAFSANAERIEAQIDPRRIEQVLINLLSNAIKYSPQGGPVAVTLERDVTKAVLEMRVRDAGMGIPAQHQARIFGRFVRADNAQAAGVCGTGLGLYLCRALVEQHGGQLWFESTEGVGSTFFTTLPLEPPAKSGPL